MLYAIPLLGLMTGCRTMSPMAVLCWFLYLGELKVEGTWAFWAAKLVTVIVFTVLAAGELIGDKLPQTPNRTALMPLVARMLFGGLVGAIVATGLHASLNIGVLAGSVFALAGAFLGYHIRHWLVASRKLPDFAVALAEDAVVIGVSIAALRLLHA
jgi:uncharacterized membrane protein